MTKIHLDEEARRLVETALVLTAAAGGKIVVRQEVINRMGSGRLVITEDVTTGNKTYEIVQSPPEPTP